LKQEEIVEFALKVRTLQDAEKLIKILETFAKEWNYVGDIATNQGAINIYEDPAYALIERLTNGMDAVLELMMLENPSITAKSPHEAVSKLLGIDSVSKLSINDDTLNSVKKRINIELSDSGIREKPTVIISDDGIGIHPKEARMTILSLHGNNKKGKFHLHGMFGQGGSGTFASCEISIIITRKASIALDGNNDLIGITVVKKTHEDDEQLPSYKYLCCNDLNIPGFDPTNVTGFDRGVHVIHVEYDIGKIHKRPVYDSNGLSGFLGQRMFDPALPVTFIGSRTTPSDLHNGAPLVRTARGLTYRLKDKRKGRPRAFHNDEITISLGKGKGEVRVRLWLVHWPKDIQKTARRARQSYIPSALNPIVFTNSGQVIDSLDTAWFRRNIHLGLVAESIIMDISLDKLDHKAKATLVGGNRKMVRNQLHDDILKHIVDRLSNDDKLKYWEEQFQNRRTVREVVDEELARRLGDKIDTFLNNTKGSIKVTGSSGTKTGGTDKKEEPKKKNLPVLPTRIICNPAEILLRQGSSANFTIDIDAQEGLLDQEGNTLDLVWEGDTTGITTSKGVLKNGKVGCHIRVGKGVVTGKRMLKVELKLAEKTLKDTIPVEIKEPKKSSNKKQVRKVKSPPTGPKIQWVKKEEWVEHDWTEKDIGKVEFTADETKIILNRDAEYCGAYCDAPGKSEQWLTRLENEWILQVGFGVFRLDYHNEKIAVNGNRMTDEQMASTKAIFAETVNVGKES